MGSQVQETRDTVATDVSCDSGVSTATNDVKEASPSFTFSGTDIVVTTGKEFAQAIGKLPTSILETDVKSGGLERWFASSLSDESMADSLRKVREGGAVGEELRLQVAYSAAKYAVDAGVEQAAPVMTVTVSDGAQTTG